MISYQKIVYYKHKSSLFIGIKCKMYILFFICNLNIHILRLNIHMCRLRIYIFKLHIKKC
ncbi:hypothetical protein SAMN02745171_00181 [Porphyromonas circumdentaria]|uniref:Uncharacterized protein n=1 Tax=Porphyromonas circumdentaria TaxID=29524 RepID=A0A1T4KW63_9PORP|nr:hypothetical protein [Porphyromonas circumdentaria]SJZ46603.1 hypothetical protein SAMN02745171_00181 [Porphyromonas circumdentaria]